MHALGRSALARNWPNGVTGFAVDALDGVALEEALMGCDAVMLALSIPRISRSPFSALTGPPDLHSKNAAVLIPLLEKLGIERVVKLSAQGVGDSAPRAGWGFRALVAFSNLRPAFLDHALADEAFLDSGLEVTVLRPPMLVDDEGGEGVHPNPEGVTWTWTRVSTGDVARFAVGCLGDPSTSGCVLTLLPGTAP